MLHIYLSCQTMTIRLVGEIVPKMPNFKSLCSDFETLVTSALGTITDRENTNFSEFLIVQYDLCDIS